VRPYNARLAHAPWSESERQVPALSSDSFASAGSASGSTPAQSARCWIAALRREHAQLDRVRARRRGRAVAGGGVETAGTGGALCGVLAVWLGDAAWGEGGCQMTPGFEHWHGTAPGGHPEPEAETVASIRAREREDATGPDGPRRARYLGPASSSFYVGATSSGRSAAAAVGVASRGEPDVRPRSLRAVSWAFGLSHFRGPPNE
jgi:hypothetical protein